MRPLTGPGELDLFTRLSYQLDHELADDFAAGRRRPAWTWVALRGDHLVARLSWWSPPGARTPLVLDVLDVDDTLPDAVDVGVQLLRTATAAVVPDGAIPPEYVRYVPGDWHEDRAAGDVVRTRVAVVERLGARPIAERLRFEWRRGTPPPGTSGRLELREPKDTEELLSLMASVMEGTLDAHGQADLARMSPREAAELHFWEEIARYPSPREWWRVAALPDGTPVGFVFPARNPYNAMIGYIGVVPAHRGRGHIDDLLAEGTRVLAEQDVPRIRAATDLDNVPMAAAFARAGYVNFERVVNLAWGPTVPA
ncbi:acetyltransferase (GNAT) family protein [Nocardiopsis sp. Huas11]|uniref:GNAT family N-acetyltransferase n=1 Tax=Nocardiopsis sp. Huas11 TaxID=2183912 RepID=UPI000F1A87B8|nr:GNAT family N-acetyltransferase [Nocardiopsis sp. Huas11]RKS09100.1 acetyltransferase (GNAT) family protein [Nocardiopsis sp. Huas11]